jgi:hypothetical protein
VDAIRDFLAKFRLPGESLQVDLYGRKERTDGRTDGRKEGKKKVEGRMDGRKEGRKLKEGS